MSAMASLTVTVSLCWPGSMVKSTRISEPTSTTTFSRESVLNPGNSTRTVYVPGVNVGALYSPASSEVTVRARPLCVSMMLTVAPGMTAPVGSLTLPRIRPKLPCADSAREKSNTSRVVMSTHPVILGFNLTDVIAFSISNAPLTIWSGSRCIVLQVVRNLPTPNQVQIWFRIATQNSGFLFRRGSNVAKSRRRRNDDHKEKPVKQATPPIAFHVDISSGGAGDWRHQHLRSTLSPD